VAAVSLINMVASCYGAGCGQGHSLIPHEALLLAAGCEPSPQCGQPVSLLPPKEVHPVFPIAGDLPGPPGWPVLLASLPGLMGAAMTPSLPTGNFSEVSPVIPEKGYWQVFLDEKPKTTRCGAPRLQLPALRLSVHHLLPS
jgi:hypothetical protein